MKAKNADNRIFKEEDNITAEPVVNLDSIKEVLKVITDEIYISVKLPMKNNYKIPVYFPPVKFFLFKLKDRELVNEAIIHYQVKFSMGFDITDKISEYYKNGVYHIPYLQKEIKILTTEVEKTNVEKKEDFKGDFTIGQIDSLDKRAVQVAKDSLEYYTFKVKIKNNKPVITHKKL